MMSNTTALGSDSPPPIRLQWPVRAEPPPSPVVPADAHDHQSLADSTAVAPAAEIAAPVTPLAHASRPKSEEVAEAVYQLNQHFKGLAKTRLQFRLDDAADRLVVKVMDVDTDELIRQLPPEEILKLAAFMNSRAAAAEALTATGPRSATAEGLLVHAKV